MRDIHCPKDIGFVDTFSGEDCEKEQYYNNCYHCWSTALAKRKAYWEMPVQEDCISREHLLEEISSLKESPWFKDDTNCAMAIRKEAIEIVEDLCIRKEPSVNQKMIGHWIDSPYDKDFLQCSECGSNWEKLIIENCNMDYCPNCGSYNGGN